MDSFFLVFFFFLHSSNLSIPPQEFAFWLKCICRAIISKRRRRRNRNYSKVEITNVYFQYQLKREKSFFRGTKQVFKVLTKLAIAVFEEIHFFSVLFFVKSTSFCLSLNNSFSLQPRALSTNKRNQ